MFYTTKEHINALAVPLGCIFLALQAAVHCERNRSLECVFEPLVNRAFAQGEKKLIGSYLTIIATG